MFRLVLLRRRRHLHSQQVPPKRKRKTFEVDLEVVVLAQQLVVPLVFGSNFAW